MQKKKVLFLIGNLSGGGAEKVLSTLVKYMDKSRFDVRVCCIRDEGKYRDEVRRTPSVTYSYLLADERTLRGRWEHWAWNLKYCLIHIPYLFRHVYRFLLPKGFDVEVAFLEDLSTKLISYSTNQNSKKIAWVHANLYVMHWNARFYKKSHDEIAAYRRFDKVIGVSEEVCDSIRALYFEDERTNRVLMLRNPIDSGDIRRRGGEGPRLERKRQFRLVSVGRLEPAKAFMRLLHIVSRLCRDGYSVELWLLGEGKERGMLEEYIGQEQLEEYVTLWGFQDNPYSYVAQCDIFVCSSLTEGYSMAVTEAIILGLPVVTTDCAGMADLLQNGAGLITENSEEALEQGLRTVLDHPDLLEEYKAKTVERGKDFTIEVLMKPIEELFLH
ncbi:MAG: glycosyltransferase [Mediterranea sp.]|jgi:glycosyltransferase involved in cell wall biosynthesis|nr:glycosyltransferase [Mediterranea sp.]